MVRKIKKKLVKKRRKDGSPRSSRTLSKSPRSSRTRSRSPKSSARSVLSDLNDLSCREVVYYAKNNSIPPSVINKPLNNGNTILGCVLLTDDIDYDLLNKLKSEGAKMSVKNPDVDSPDEIILGRYENREISESELHDIFSIFS